MDPVSNMISKIKNALSVHKETVSLAYSKIKLEVVKILKKEGFIEDYKHKENEIIINLKYRGKKPIISDIKRISKPGCRIYAQHKKIPSVLRGLGIVIISTPAGVMTGREAKKKSLGGELICKVW
jgi:small subunit ribosomal protein S8